MCPVFQGDSTVVGTSKLRDLYERFEEELGRRQERAKAARPKWEPPKTKLDEDPGGWRSFNLTDLFISRTEQLCMIHSLKSASFISH